MNAQDLRAIAEAIGWPMAVVLFVGFILAKNGWLKVIMRDDKKDEMENIKERLHALEEDTRSLWKQDARKSSEIYQVKTDVAVLNDRWSRKD